MNTAAISVQFWHIKGIYWGLAILLAAGYLKFGDVTQEQAMLKHRGARQGFKWSLLHENNSLGRYDSVLNQFENEEGGIRDLEFE